MSDKPKPDIETHRQDESEGVVILTRARWDANFLGIAVLALGVAMFSYLATEEIFFLLWPLCILPFWLMVRFNTPRCGTKVRPIPGGTQLFVWLGFMMVVITGVAAFDNFVIGHGFREPLKIYHLGLFAPLLIVLLVGVWVIEKRYPKVKLPDAESGARMNE